MEHLFSMRRKPLKCEPPHFERASDLEVVRPICTISCGNIIAFSSPTELTDQECDTWGGHVYVCDLETPWDAHKVISTTHAISALEWDGEGRQLLVATTDGTAAVLGQRDYLINEWVTLYTTNYPGEHILKGIFFHNGRRFVLLDKKADAPVAERLQALRPAPTLGGYGGTACSGICVVTSTGLVACAAPCPSPSPSPAGGPAPAPLARAADSLRAHRLAVTAVSMMHTNGAILAACVCVPPGGAGGGGGAACVRCVRVGVSLRAPREPRTLAPALSLSLTPLPTLVCNHVPTSIAWQLGGGGCGGGVGGETGESLLVLTRGAGSGALALWRLEQRAHPPHKMLPKDKAPHTLKVWQQTGMWAGEGAGAGAGGGCGGHVCSVRGPPFPSPASAPGPGAAPAPVAVVAAGGALHVAGRGVHTYLYSRAVPLWGGAGGGAAGGGGGGVPEGGGGGSPPKKPKYGRSGNEPSAPALCCVQTSWLGGVVLAVDTAAQLHVYTHQPPPPAPSLPAATDMPPPLAVAQTTALLEYALVSGTDCLDALLTLKPPLVEAVYERLTESFQRQPSQFQQYYYHAWLKMRIALCRLSGAAWCAVSGLTSLLTLWGAWAAVLPALRHLDSQHLDHPDDKAILSLESKLELSPEAAALATLRRPLARALDIAATALAAAADPSAAHRHHGYELWADPVGTSLLRKLLLVARAAGLRDAPLSATLARLHQPAKPELIEECNAVSGAWPGRVWEVYPRTGVSVSLAAPPAPAAAAARPLICPYFAPPARLRSAPPAPPCAATDGTPTADMDSIRYMYLGASGAWRGCSRCGARALPPPAPPRAALQRAHDARFLPTCRCGGKWTLFREGLTD